MPSADYYVRNYFAPVFCKPAFTRWKNRVLGEQPREQKEGKKKSPIFNAKSKKRGTGPNWRIPSCGVVRDGWLSCCSQKILILHVLSSL